jgi:predicted small lipoprotein YifL
MDAMMRRYGHSSATNPRIFWIGDGSATENPYRFRGMDPSDGAVAMLPVHLEPPVTRAIRLHTGLIGIGVLAAALLLAGCGRKGPLDPPPGGWQVQQQGRRMAPVSTKPAPPAPVEYDALGRPIAPEGPSRRIPADWLID